MAAGCARSAGHMRDGNLVEITSSGIRVARGDLIEGRFYADANRSGMSYYYIAFH